MLEAPNFGIVTIETSMAEIQFYNGLSLCISETDISIVINVRRTIIRHRFLGK